MGNLVFNSIAICWMLMLNSTSC